MIDQPQNFSCRQVKEYTPESNSFGKTEATILTFTFIIAYAITSLFT